MGIITLNRGRSLSELNPHKRLSSTCNQQPATCNYIFLISSPPPHPASRRTGASGQAAFTASMLVGGGFWVAVR
jgi:hypothetical protein